MLARIVGLLLGLGLGGLGWAILDPRALEGRIPPIPLGPFQPESTTLGAACALLGLVILVAALMPKGPGGPGGKRRRGATPTADFTSGPALPAPPPDGGASLALDQDIAARALVEALAAPSPHPSGAPPGEDDFTATRTELHAQARSEA